MTPAARGRWSAGDSHSTGCRCQFLPRRSAGGVRYSHGQLRGRSRETTLRVREQGRLAGFAPSSLAGVGPSSAPRAVQGPTDQKAKRHCYRTCAPFRAIGRMYEHKVPKILTRPRREQGRFSALVDKKIAKNIYFQVKKSKYHLFTSEAGM